MINESIVHVVINSGYSNQSTMVNYGYALLWLSLSTVMNGQQINNGMAYLSR